VSSLVTGGGGFVGQWLIRELLGRGEKVFGFTFGAPGAIGVLSAGQERQVQWIDGDIRDSVSVGSAIEEAQPDTIFHLAGVTFVPAAGDDPTSTYEVNVLGASRLLAAVARGKSRGSKGPRVLVVGSAEQYGPHSTRASPLAESTPQNPVTVYGASKSAQETIALQAAVGQGLDVVATRSFNHSGRGQDPRFLLPGLIQRIRTIANAQADRLKIGNTEVVRDFLHVEDVARAYVTLLETGERGHVYNVCSGKGSTVRELADLALRVAGVTATLERDPGLTRSTDIEWSVGDNRKLRQRTGWAPARGVEDILRDLWGAAR
jgi:GDP-4-dehydro-6-deoxy-D-mannose reductase